jgi:ubiquinone/menaquinone biosynthesis C-methylase UbiE
VLERIQAFEYLQKPIDCSFVGGISKLHIDSYRLLELLAKETPIEFWGYGVNTTAQDSPIRKRHRGEAWGRKMFEIFSSSKIVINRHGEVAENYANNMRLYEATGCGALLITDHKDNLNEPFKIGKEIVTFRSPEECVALVNYYLANPKEAATIARAGQARTLRDHTYPKRMAQTTEILERHLRYKGEKNIYPMPRQISNGHTLIKPSQISIELTTGWQDESIPAKQRGLVQKELAAMYRNKPPAVFQALAASLCRYAYPDCSILEIGCASGYYYEVLEYLLNHRITYTGVDYSAPLISMAKSYYPGVDFQVADGANLPFPDERFIIAISSCVLLHVPNYREHINETVRVAERYVVSHRTPVCRKRSTQYLKKFAYGVETVELLFNEDEILSQFLSHDLKLIETNEYYADPNNDRFEITYLFEKTDISVKQLAPIESSPIHKDPFPVNTNETPVMLNLGCGRRYHKDWKNIDFQSSGPDVMGHNLCLGIPVPDESCDVVYHSHVLEHFPKRFAPEFLKECYRALKPGGIIRVVQPDLEQLVRLYLHALEKSLQGDPEAQKRYEWIMIELFDQMVRNRPGGEMLEYWRQNPMPAEAFVVERCGSEVLGALQHIRSRAQPVGFVQDPYLLATRNKDESEIKKMAMFRMSGEVHQWMYDRYSLMKLLENAGLERIKTCRADESDIPDFNTYQLDVEPNGKVRKPDSFFMEAHKPAHLEAGSLV